MNVTLPSVPMHREWWVIRTPEGPKTVDYRPNTRAGAIGPFSTPFTAAMKVAELEARAAGRRTKVRLASFAVGLVLAVGAAAVLLP